MKTPDFTYHRPETVDEALALLARYGEDAKILAGGQSLLPIMQLRLAEPAHLVDVTAIAELRRYREYGGGCAYGATTTHMMLEQRLVPDVTGGLLPSVAAGIGYRAIRTKGTIAGSLAHADSSAEWPTVLAALDAAVRVRSASGARSVPVRELLLGFFTTALEPDELITAVEVPEQTAENGSGFYKYARKPGEFAKSLAVVLRARARAHVWLGAARPIPVPLPETSRYITDRGEDTPAVDELVQTVGADIGTPPQRCGPAQRHALQLHAASVQRAALATERSPV